MDFILDIVFRGVVYSEYTTKKLNVIVVLLLSMSLRFLIDCIVSYIISVVIGGWGVTQFLLQLMCSVIIIRKYNFIHTSILKNEHLIYGMTMYVLTHYTQEKFQYWRRVVTVTVCITGIIYTCFYTVNVQLILLQYLLCFIIVDLLELYYKRPRLGLFRGPKVTVLQPDPTGSKPPPEITPKTEDPPPKTPSEDDPVVTPRLNNRLNSGSVFGISGGIVDNYK